MRQSLRECILEVPFEALYDYLFDVHLECLCGRGTTGFALD